MTSTRADVASTPPYAPWGTFYNFFVTLKNSVIPPQIDSSIMSRMSGSAQTQVRGALRFFNLIDDAGVVQPAFKALVDAAGTDSWQGAFEQPLFDSYAPVIGDLDIDRATLKQLADRFRDYANLSGSVLRKAVRFYLDGLSSTGTRFSPHFKMRGLSTIAGDRPTRNGGSTRAPKRRTAALPEPKHPHGSVNLHAGPDDFVIKLPGRAAIVIPLPPDLREAEWNFIDNQVRGFMTLRADRDGREEEHA